MTLTKGEIKVLRSLQQKKCRESERLFVVEGPKMVEELIMQENYQIEHVYHTSDWSPGRATPVSFQISPAELERISSLTTPNKVLATVRIPEANSLKFSETNLILLLDDVKDPGNLGTIIRTAEWFGIHQLVLSEQCVDIYNSKVVQATMGALFRMNFVRTDLSPAVAELKLNGFEIAVADMAGKSLFEHKFNIKTALILGNESHGISSELISIADESITIPRSGETESLNVAMATGIFCSAYRSQFSG